MVRPSGAPRGLVHAGPLRPAARNRSALDSWRQMQIASSRSPDLLSCSTTNRRAAIAYWESTDSPPKPTSESSPNEKIAFGIGLRRAGRSRNRGTRRGRGRRRSHARRPGHLRSLHGAGRSRSRPHCRAPVQLRARRCRGAPRAQPAARRSRLRRLRILWWVRVAARRLRGPTRSEANDRARGVAADRWPRTSG